MIAAVWPSTLAGRVARLIAACPDLGRRLALAPEKTLHMLAIWLHSTVSAEKDDREIAAILLSTEARSLLAEAMPGHAPDLPPALGRVGARVKEREFYADLDALLRGPAARALPKEGPIMPVHLSTAQAITEFGPPLTCIAGALAGSDHRVQAAAGAVRYLRALGLASSIEHTPPGSGWKAFSSRLMADLDAARAPVAEFAVPPKWRVIETVCDLREVGHRLRLCVAEFAFGSSNYLNSFLGGKAVFLTSDEHKTLALVARFAGEWVVTEISRRGNGPPPSHVRRELEDGLRAAGLSVASMEPFIAVEFVLSEGRRRAMDLSLAEDA